jgi:hypothetical protein
LALPQETAADLLKKLHDGDAAEQKAAADALVKKGSSAKAAVQKAYDKAGTDFRPRYEEVLIRIDCGSDAPRQSFGSLDLEVREAAATSEAVPKFGDGVKLKAIFDGTNGGNDPVVATIAKASLVTAKGKVELLVKGPKGEPFSRTFDSQAPKMIEYGAILPPRYPPGTRLAIVFEIEVDGARKLLRSGIITVEKKE